jgi:acylphosphatase
MQSRRYIVKGRVQGVWFRATVSQLARDAGMPGYVRNLADGSVEAAVSCDNEGCFEAFEALLWQGSPLSVVEQVTTEPIEEIFEGEFEQR